MFPTHAKVLTTKKKLKGGTKKKLNCYNKIINESGLLKCIICEFN